MSPVQRGGVLHWILGLAFASALSAAPTGPVDPAGPAPVKAKPAAKTAIKWEVRPGDVVVYLDRKKLGRAADLEVTPAKPGRHTIRLVNGADETEIEIEVTKGQILRFVLDFSE